MVHHPSFLYHFLNALYDLDADKAVGEHKSEEDAFGFQIVLLVLNRLLPLLFRPLTLPLQVAFSHQLVMFHFEVGRARRTSGCSCPCRNVAGGLWCRTIRSRPKWCSRCGCKS